MQNGNSCCFFGHRDAPGYILPKLIELIEYLIIDENVNNFYVGNQGEFDSMVYSALKRLKQKYPQISYAVVLAYLPTDKRIVNEYDGNTIYPEGLDCVPKRFAIAKRNEWMIANSSCCISYVTHDFGGAAKYTESAKKKGLTIYNVMKYITSIPPKFHTYLLYLCYYTTNHNKVNN